MGLGRAEVVPKPPKRQGCRGASYLLGTGPGWHGARIAVCTSRRQMAMAASWPSRALRAPAPARASDGKALNRYSSRCLLLRLKSGLTRNLRVPF